MDEEIDELVVPQIGRYKMAAAKDAREFELKAVNRSGADEELGTAPDGKTETDAKPLIEKIKNALGDRVKDVKLSRRLQDSPSCIVADENDPSVQMAQMLKALGQGNIPEVVPILEVNPAHPLVAGLKDTEDALVIADTAGVLLDQALLVEGVKLKDPADFVKRLNRLLSRKGG
jgi:molecular chaperone HtpG